MDENVIKINKNTCVYFHINPIKQEIFYVGIGNKKRPYVKGDRVNYWHRIVKKYGYNVIIIHENLTWSEACELEIKYIKQIGRKDLGLGTLINMTDGGDGTHGHKLSEETKKKISESLKGRVGSNLGRHWTISEEGRKNISNSKKGKPSGTKGKTPWNKGLTKKNDIRVVGNSKDFKGEKSPMYGKSVKNIWIEKYGEEKAEELWKEKNKKISELLIGKPSGKKGKSLSEESKRKLSESRKGKKQSVETIQKRAKNNTGKKRTEDIKKKMSEAQKNRYKKLKNEKEVFVKL